ncbi:GNAT family N-acetyltransferase [Nioella ostreopsis]|uniref:GNAT family N-acetyltransferase n=1 Tax=Nioella ostreopsis TaxID=2448479 RepID=UPI000FD6D84D|nr:GNAT family N-acetyltransferase [Nioella ostreopsis]
MIRPARPEDAEAIAAIWNRIIRDTAATFTTEEKDPSAIADAMGTQPFWVALENGAILGFATYSQFRGGPGYARTMEHSVHVAKGSEGRGIGRALIAVLEDHARAQGIHSLIAGISGENPAGIAFHAALGYANTARLPQVGWKFGRWHDLVLMQKFL